MKTGKSYLPAIVPQKGDSGVPVLVRVNVQACLLCGCKESGPRNARGMPIGLPAHDKSLYLKSIHHGGKWTMDNLIEKRTGVSGSRQAASE